MRLSDLVKGEGDFTESLSDCRRDQQQCDKALTDFFLNYVSLTCFNSHLIPQEIMHEFSVLVCMTVLKGLNLTGLYELCDYQ